MNCILEDLLHACILDFRGSWDDHFHLVKFAYSNNYQSSIGMEPFEALNGQSCNAPSYWWVAGMKLILGPNMVWETLEKIKIIRQ